MNFNDDIAVVRAFKAGEPRRIRIGPLHERHPGRSCGLIVTTIAFIWHLPVSSPRLHGIFLVHSA
jgi:hypothetical protein